MGFIVVVAGSLVRAVWGLLLASSWVAELGASTGVPDVGACACACVLWSWPAYTIGSAGLYTIFMLTALTIHRRVRAIITRNRLPVPIRTLLSRFLLLPSASTEQKYRRQDQKCAYYPADHSPDHSSVAM